MEKELVKEFIQIMSKLIEKELNKKKFARYKSAKVESINSNGSVNVKIPPSEAIIHNLLNKTGETLSKNDDVSLLLKDGTMSTAVVANKNKTNLKYNTATGNGDSLTSDLVEKINSAIQGVKVNNTLLKVDTNNKVNITIPTTMNDLINDGYFVQDQYYIHTDNNLTNEVLEKINSSIKAVNVNNTLLTLNENQEVNITVPINLTDLTNDGYFVQDQNYVHTDNNFTTILKNNYDNLVSNVNQIVSSTNKLATIKDIKDINIDNYYKKKESDTIFIKQEEGKELITAKEKAKLEGIANDANKVEKSNTNGNIKINDIEVNVYSLTKGEVIEALGYTPIEATVDLSDYYDKQQSDERYIQKEIDKGLSTCDYSIDQKNKLKNIEENAQVNKIENVKVNGTNLSITNKTIDLTMPTNVSELNNDKNYVGLSDLFNKIYPVGSIYMSANSTNPNILFGGTWIQLQDRFLLGAGTTYSNGATGGEKTHQLTIAETPAHTHTRGTMNITGDFKTRGMNTGDDNPVLSSSGAFSITKDTWSGKHDVFEKVSVADKKTNLVKLNASSSWSGATSSVGSNAAHNNMPPYLVVYMWKRTS